MIQYFQNHSKMMINLNLIVIMTRKILFLKVIVKVILIYRITIKKTILKLANSKQNLKLMN
jgi:hypothetical protein